MKIKKMINISKFLMLAALCNPIISENNEENNKENSEIIVCPEVNHIKYNSYQHACQKLVALENNQLKWFLEQEEASKQDEEAIDCSIHIIDNWEHIMDNWDSFMKYLKEGNANNATIDFFKKKKEENSEILVCPEPNNIKYDSYQYLCQKVVALKNNQLKWSLKQHYEDAKQYLVAAKQNLEAAKRKEKERDTAPTMNDFWLKNDQVQQHLDSAVIYIAAKESVKAKIDAIAEICEDYNNFMKYLKECNATEATISFFNIEKRDNYINLWNMIHKYNANEKTIAYFKNEDETEDETENETIENNDNKNQ